MSLGYRLGLPQDI